MCGIVGYWDRRGAEASVVEKMAQQIRNQRGGCFGCFVYI